MSTHTLARCATSQTCVCARTHTLTDTKLLLAGRQLLKFRAGAQAGGGRRGWSDRWREVVAAYVAAVFHPALWPLPALHTAPDGGPGPLRRAWRACWEVGLQVQHTHARAHTHTHKHTQTHTACRSLRVAPHVTRRSRCACSHARMHAWAATRRRAAMETRRAPCGMHAAALHPSVAIGDGALVLTDISDGWLTALVS
jgi:hypothetical protein